jgi:hypothetical protein
MGYGSVRGLYAEAKRLRVSLENEQPLVAARLDYDWTRSLAAVEIAFGSDVFGSGFEWMTTTGLDDYETLQTLRALQTGAFSWSSSWDAAGHPPPPPPPLAPSQGTLLHTRALDVACTGERATSHPCRAA